MSHKDESIAVLTESVGELTSEVYRLWDMNTNQLRQIEALAVESDDRAQELDRVHAAIEAAVSDLRTLECVPAGQVFQCIGEIVGALRAVIV